MRDDELVRRIAEGDWVPDDDAAAHRRPAVARIVELVRRRRRRRRFAAMAGGGLACASVVVATALVLGASDTGTVAPAGTSKTPATPTTAATEPPEERCGNEWVVISLGAYEGGGGLRQPVEVSNIGKHVCSVSVPSLALVPDDGPAVPVRGPAVQEVMLQPGTMLSLMVSTVTACDDAVVVDSIRIDMNDGWMSTARYAHLASGCNPAPQVTDVSVHAIRDRGQEVPSLAEITQATGTEFAPAAAGAQPSVSEHEALSVGKADSSLGLVRAAFAPDDSQGSQPVTWKLAWVVVEADQHPGLEVSGNGIELPDGANHVVSIVDAESGEILKKFFF